MRVASLLPCLGCLHDAEARDEDDHIKTVEVRGDSMNFSISIFRELSHNTLPRSHTAHGSPRRTKDIQYISSIIFTVMSSCYYGAEGLPFEFCAQE